MEKGDRVIVRNNSGGTYYIPHAQYYGMSKSGKRVAVIFNAYYPFGVNMQIRYFKPENVRKSPFGTHLPDGGSLLDALLK